MGVMNALLGGYGINWMAIYENLISGSMAKWKTMPSAVFQGSIEESLLFNVSISGIGSGTEASLLVMPN